jgi:H+/Cl- antiporter ClcA
LPDCHKGSAQPNRAARIRASQFDIFEPDQQDRAAAIACGAAAGSSINFAAPGSGNFLLTFT